MGAQVFLTSVAKSRIALATIGAMACLLVSEHCPYQQSLARHLMRRVLCVGTDGDIFLAHVQLRK